MLHRRRVFYGWWIVAAGVVLAAMNSALYIYGFSALFIPWQKTFGWPRALLGGVIGVARLEGGLVGPVAGWLVDRYGPKRIMLVGLSMFGLGYIALSRVNSLLMLYVVFLGLLSLGSSFGGLRPVQVAVANWFVRYRGRAMGLLMTGSSLGGTVVFLFAMTIDKLGWRTASVIAGLVILGIGLPLAFIVRHKPEQMGLLPDGRQVPVEMEVGQVAGGKNAPSQESQGGNPLAASRGDDGLATSQPLKARHFWMRDPSPEVDLTAMQATKTGAFWIMALIWGLWSTIAAINTVHLAPFLNKELNIEYVAAVGFLSFFAFTTIFGRLGFGFLVDYMNPRLVLAILLLMEGTGIVLFSQVHTLSQVYLSIIVFGFAHGGTVIMRPVLQGYFFGRKEFGTIGGLLTLVDLPGGVGAPILVGWMADVLPGGYRLAFAIIGAVQGIGAIAILLARRPRSPLPTDRLP